MHTPDAGHGYWEKNAKRYDRSMKVLGGPLPRAAELCSEAVSGTRVLEVAAGTGLITLGLAQTAASVVATDYSEAMVDQLRARVERVGLTNVTCEAVDVYAMPYEAASFDVVVAANVLHLLPDLPGALQAITRILKPGGHLIAPTYCHDETFVAWLMSRILKVTGFPGQRRFSVSSLRETIERAGFEVVRSERIPGLMPIGYVEGRLP